MTFFLLISDYIYIILLPDNKVKTNAVFTAIHPATYRGGGILAHGVLNQILISSYTYPPCLNSNPKVRFRRKKK